MMTFPSGVFSSPEQHSWRAIVLPSASVALAFLHHLIFMCSVKHIFVMSIYVIQLQTDDFGKAVFQDCGLSLLSLYLFFRSVVYKVYLHQNFFKVVVHVIIIDQ